MTPKRKFRGAVFFDLDGTLLDHSISCVPASAARGVEELKKNGYLVCLATGRDMDTHYSVKYLEQAKPDAVIHSNGNKITAFGEEIFRHSMDPELMKRIFDYVEARGLCAGTSIGECDYFTKPELKLEADAAFMKPVKRNFRPVSELFEKNIPVLALSFAGIHSEEIKRIVEADFPELELFCFNRGTGADVVERGFSKAEGIKRICSRYGIPAENTWAFGDSANDVPMFAVTAHSVAMGNADEEVKEQAEYVTDDISKDGVWNALKHYGLI